VKRSQINSAVKEAQKAFERHCWFLPPDPKWDVTDFGLGDFNAYGLVLVNLTEQPEYCEKIMYAKKGQITIRHFHKVKKEDIICRSGRLAIRLFSEKSLIRVQVNGREEEIPTGEVLILEQGWRITLEPGTEHEFWADSEYTLIGEVSSANDDVSDNYFYNPDVGRFSEIEEDEAAFVRLVNEHAS